MELSKDALKAIKQLNKEIKKQGISKQIQVTDETEELLKQLPKSQLLGVISHYAYFLFLMGQAYVGRSIPFELSEVMMMVGLREDLDKPDNKEEGNFFVKDSKVTHPDS